jgi:nitrogen fixation/metabolism regulation signal transduction histidine kinase
LYNTSGDPYHPPTSVDFADLIRNFQGEKYKTAYPGIYFISTPTAEATKQYLVIVPVKRHQLAAGFVVLNLKLKKVIPRNVYPELLVDNRFSHYFKSKEFSYAVYSKGKLTNSFGEFNYDKDFDESWLTTSLLFQNGVAKNGFYHIGIEDLSGQSAIVSARVYPVFFLITNFSFLFVLGLVVVLLVLLIIGAATWSRGTRLDYAARIQGYVYLAFFLPLVTVSITTLSLTNRSAEVQLQTEYEERSRILGEKMSGPLEEFMKDPDHYRSENQIAELANLADLDASVYGADGKLIVSSQPLIFENQLLSTLINRKAWHAIARDKETSFIADEKIGKLRYNCAYVAVKSAQSGSELGILSIPFFGSAQSLEKIQINVLANILTVFVLVFILFSVLSFLVANGLTFPLRFIAKSIKKTTLTDKNQIIQWNSNDEIGLLAGEYNRMIKNLEQSRNELARVQKETAWREIAKQVAHEIKNPLTPMKLTLQQMEQSLDNKDLSPEKSRKAVATLLTQLEILNEIATSFSTFARMPAPVLERIDLHALLKNIVGLHQTYPEGTVLLTVVLKYHSQFVTVR